MSIRSCRVFEISRQLISLLVLAQCFLLGLGSLEACPSFLQVKDLGPLNKASIRRSQLQLFVLNSESSQNWIRQPLQIDPLDEEGNLLFPEDVNWLNSRVSGFDRLSFSTENFARQFVGSGKEFPCRSEQILEIEAKSGFAYLVVCRQDSSPLKSEFPVRFDEKKRLVSTSQYRFNYNELNHLVFDRIELFDEKLDTYQTVAADADILMLGDVENFFTFYFGTEDVDAFIKNKRFGPMGLMGGLQFYLKILYFKLKISLMPEVNFFEDSLYMPITLTLPVDAKKYLRRGSGIFYTWISDKRTQWLWDKSLMEDLKPSDLDPKTADPIGLPTRKYCNRQKCAFSLLGKSKGRDFSINFIVSRKAAELGFYPRIIRDVAAVEKSIKHPVSRYPVGERMGIFFEISKLPKGEHTWDFWIHFPEQEQGLCSSDFKVKLLSRSLP